MAALKEHCEDCLKQLGEEFKEVHLWLDEWFKYDKTIKHRILRHHKEGVEEIRKRWGDKAAKAAELHIIMDMGKVLSANDINVYYNMRWRDPRKFFQLHG